MYQNFNYEEMQGAVMENLARIYKESFDSQEQIDEKKNEETYCKVRKILDCAEMEKCHPYLYSLDMMNLNEDDASKIEKIYQLGLNRGILTEEDEINDKETTNECDDSEYSSCEDDELCGGPKDALTNQELHNIPTINKPKYTVLYSANKDGQCKMGEFYSFAYNTEGAKEDCIMQLTQGGYDNISIMAIEQTAMDINTDIDDSYVDKSLDCVNDKVFEDDSEEYLKQETGATFDDTEEEKQKEEKQEEEKAEDVEQKETEKSSEDSEKKEDDSEDNEETKEEDKEDDKEDDKTEDDKTEETENDEKELTADEKESLKTEYKNTFKDILKKMKLEKSVSDMNLEEKTEFYKKLAEKWQKNDPSEFMDSEEQEKLNSVVIKEK